MIQRHLWFTTALFGLLLGAAIPAGAQYDAAGQQDGVSPNPGLTLKPPTKPAPVVTGSGIVSPPPPAWNSGTVFTQQPSHNLHESAPIISDPPNAPPRPNNASPAPVMSSAPSAADTLQPLPPAEPAPAASISVQKPSYVVPPLRDITTAPEQEIKPLPGAAITSPPEAMSSQPSEVISSPPAVLKPLPAPAPQAEPQETILPQPSPAARQPPVHRPSLQIIEAPEEAAPPAHGTRSSPPHAGKAAPPPVAVVQAPATPPLPTPDMPAVPTLADLTLLFSGNSSDLTPETQTKLNGIVRQLNDMSDGRLQVRGYATGEDGSTSGARRIALSRVLSVRSYLMDKGVKPTRVDVRAMGTETDRSPLDRVDLLFER